MTAPAPTATPLMAAMTGRRTLRIHRHVGHQEGAGGKADQADPVHLQGPVAGPLADQLQRAAAVVRGDLSGVVQRLVADQPGHRPRRLGGRERRGQHRALRRHRRGELGRVGRRAGEPVFQQEGGVAARGEPGGDVGPLVGPRQDAPAAAWADDHAGAVGLARLGREHRQRRLGDVAQNRLFVRPAGDWPLEALLRRYVRVRSGRRCRPERDHLFGGLHVHACVVGHGDLLLVLLCTVAQTIDRVKA